MSTKFFMFFFFQAEDGIRDIGVTGVQTCALPIFLLFRVSSIKDVGYAYTHMLDGFRMNIKELRFGMCDHDWIVFGIAVIAMLLVEYANSRKDVMQWTEAQDRKSVV